MLATLAEAIGAEDEPTRLVALAFVVEHGLTGVLRFEPGGVRTSARAEVSARMARALALPPAQARVSLSEGLDADDPALVRISALELARVGPAGNATDAVVGEALLLAARRVPGTADAALLARVAAAYGR